MKISILAFIACGFFCCQREEKSPLSVIAPEGVYTGTFQRGNGRMVSVALTLADGRYTGKVLDSNGMNPGASPRICKGQFKTSPGVINFENECFFTAEFDWTLILSQEWHVASIGNQLLLDRNNDRYVLGK